MASRSPLNAEGIGPILSAAVVDVDDANRLWLFVGTHDFSERTLEPFPQRFYGVRDPVPSGPCAEVSPVRCTVRHLHDLSILEHYPGCRPRAAGSGTNAIGPRTTGLEPDSVGYAHEGWFFTFGQVRERLVGDVTGVGGLLLFPSVVAPEPDSSGPSRAYFYTLEHRTGGTARRGGPDIDIVAGMAPQRARSLPAGPVVGMWTRREPWALSGDDVLRICR